jgi:hypothetical protein
MLKNIGLIGGNGKWGQNYQKVLNKLAVPFLIGTRDNWKDLDIDGAIITTPPDSHIEIAQYYDNIPLLIEKPLALNSDFDLKNKNILVNNIHLFSPAFANIKFETSPQHIQYIKSIGTGNGPFRTYSDLWDYAPHDLAMGMILAGFTGIPKLINYKKIKNHHITVSYDGIIHEMEVGNQSYKQRYLEVGVSFGGIWIYNDLNENILTFNNQIVKMFDISPLENVVKNFVTQNKNEYWGATLSKNIIKLLEKIEK